MFNKRFLLSSLFFFYSLLVFSKPVPEEGEENKVRQHHKLLGRHYLVKVTKTYKGNRLVSKKRQVICDDCCYTYVVRERERVYRHEKKK